MKNRKGRKKGKGKWNRGRKGRRKEGVVEYRAAGRGKGKESGRWAGEGQGGY